MILPEISVYQTAADVGQKKRNIVREIKEGRSLSWICARFGVTAEEVYRLGCVHRWVALTEHRIAKCCLCGKEEYIMDVDGEYIYINLDETISSVIHRIKPWRKKT